MTHPGTSGTREKFSTKKVQFHEITPKLLFNYLLKGAVLVWRLAGQGVGAWGEGEEGGGGREGDGGVEAKARACRRTNRVDRNNEERPFYVLVKAEGIQLCPRQNKAKVT